MHSARGQSVVDGEGHRPMSFWRGEARGTGATVKKVVSKVLSARGKESRGKTDALVQSTKRNQPILGEGR